MIIRRLIVSLLALLTVMTVTAQNETTAPTTVEVELGDTIVVEGVVSEIVSPNAFVLDRVEPFDVTPGSLLVFPDTAEGFALDINLGRTIRVTGELADFNIPEIEADVAYRIDETQYTAYGVGDFALIADGVIDIATIAPVDPLVVDPVLVDEIEANPSAYYEQEVTFEGIVTDILSANAFVLERVEPFTLAPGRMVIFDDNIEGFAIDVNVGRRVRVSGSLYEFVLPALDTRLDYDIDDSAFTQYSQRDFAVVAHTVVSLTDPIRDTTVVNSVPERVEVDRIEDNPENFYGQTVTIQGELERIFTEDAFLLEEEEFFDLDPLEIVVFDQTGGVIPMTSDLGQMVEVTGEIRPYEINELESVIDAALDDFFDNIESADVALMATEVRVLNTR